MSPIAVPCVSATSVVVARAVWSEANCPRRVPAVSSKESWMPLSRLVTFTVKSTSDCFSQTPLRAAGALAARALLAGGRRYRWPLPR